MGKLENSICIINPSSGNRRWERDKVIREGVEFYINTVELTKNKEQTIELAKESAQHYSYIVAVGGDGTILDVINGIMQSGNKPVLGIVPLGTGNCFVDSLGISKDVKKACLNLAKGKPKLIDLTEIVATVASKAPFCAHKYSQVASIGLDAEILNMRNTLGKPGIRGYVVPTLKTFYSFKPQHKQIRLYEGHCLDGKVFEEKVLELDDNMQVVVNKGKYYGGKFKISPFAELDDGYLDVSLFNLTKTGTLFNFPKIYLGKKVKGVLHFKAKRVVVHGKEEMPCQHDGEFLGWFCYCGFKVKEKVIKVIVP